jgi:hypothetical protein
MENKILENQIQTWIEIVLWASIEDYVGVWEIPWELSSNGDVPQNISENLAFIIITILFDFELINYYECIEPYGDLKLVNYKDANFEQSKRFWLIPDNGEIGVRISTSKAGEELYHYIKRESNTNINEGEHIVLNEIINEILKKIGHFKLFNKNDDFNKIQNS